jgi:hypothetical protein
VTTSALSTILTIGTSDTSTNRATVTPSAEAIRVRVDTLGLVLPCSTWTSMPLLTPDLAARASSVRPRWLRWARTLVAMACVIVSGSCTSAV